tara:strand:- start:141 stop:449 length:309 start_codon:yes stop_codon:yes gene_type:complete
MLKSIQLNNSPGHTHNGQTSVVDLSTDFCPGNHLRKSNKMRNISDTLEKINNRLGRLIRTEEDFGLGFKKLSKDERMITHFEMEVIRIKINCLLELLIKEDK